MSGIEQRIADVLRKHQVTPTGEVPGEVECSCGQLCKTWDYGDGHVASVLVTELGLTEESHWGPVSVPLYDDESQPVMDERRVQPVHKHCFEWVTQHRWVTPWQESGPRETSEELAARLECAE